MKMRLHGRDDIKYSGPQTEDFVFVSAVDTSYPIQDSFYAENQLFEKYASSGTVIAVLGMIAFGMLIVCLVWLTIVAGRSNRDDELHLNWFDAMENRSGSDGSDCVMAYSGIAVRKYFITY